MRCSRSDHAGWQAGLGDWPRRSERPGPSTLERALELATVAAHGKQVSVFGGANTAQQCLVAGSVDELRSTVVPTLLADGLRLFGPDPAHRAAEIVSVVAAPTVTRRRLRLK